MLQFSTVFKCTESLKRVTRARGRTCKIVNAQTVNLPIFIQPPQIPSCRKTHSNMTTSTDAFKGQLQGEHPPKLPLQCYIQMLKESATKVTTV